MKRVVAIKKQLDHESVDDTSLLAFQSTLYDLSGAALNLLPPSHNHMALSTLTLREDSSLMLKLINYLVCHVIRMEAGSAISQISILRIKVSMGDSPPLPDSRLPEEYQAIKLVFSQGRAMKFLSGEFLIKGFTHVTPGYWLQYAPSSILLPIPIVLIMMCCASDPSPEIQSHYSWANANLDSYLAPWPLLGTKLLVEGRARCNFECPFNFGIKV